MARIAVLLGVDNWLYEKEEDKVKDKALIKAREKRGLSQQKAADKLGISRQVLSAVENRDYSKCSRDTIIRIRKFMEGLLDE